jgi:hypothetical protein
MKSWSPSQWQLFHNRLAYLERSKIKIGQYCSPDTFAYVFVLS